MPWIEPWELEKLEVKAGLLEEIIDVIDRFKAGMPYRVSRVDFPMRAEGTSSEEGDDHR